MREFGVSTEICSNKKCLRGSSHCVDYVVLEPWQEISGKLQSFKRENGFLYLQIGDSKLSFKINSETASCILEQINHTLIGRKIAILRTDIAEKPLILRLVA